MARNVLFLHVSRTDPTLSPYGTDHIQRFGEFVVDLDTIPHSPRLGIIPISMETDSDLE